jgi:hypothetical protein|tara:strand:- start:89 stop:421 length:333 start_codon:yes stop_codon:yes gene_type:complete
MKMKYWSDYEKYICMVNGEGNTPLGVGLGYQAFLEFKRVKEALIKLSKQTGNNYSHNDTIYKRPITASKATKVLEKIELCIWDDGIRKVANQIGAGGMLSPSTKITGILK